MFVLDLLRNAVAGNSRFSSGTTNRSHSPLGFEMLEDRVLLRADSVPFEFPRADQSRPAGMIAEHGCPAGAATAWRSDLTCGRKRQSESGDAQATKIIEPAYCDAAIAEMAVGE